MFCYFFLFIFIFIFILSHLKIIIIQAFPAISTGIYSYPIESATQVAFGEVRKFLDTEQAKEACLVLVLGCHSYPSTHQTGTALSPN